MLAFLKFSCLAGWGVWLDYLICCYKCFHIVVLVPCSLLANFVSSLTAKSFDANDMLTCGGEFARLFACTTVSILCLHEMDRLVIRHDQRLVWAKHSGNKAKGWSSLHLMVSQSEIQSPSQHLERCSSKHFLNRFLLYDRVLYPDELRHCYQGLLLLFMVYVKICHAANTKLKPI